MDILAKRLSNITPSATLAAATKAKALINNGHDVINLTTGEPDFDTPAYIKAAAISAINNGETKYTESGGTLALKKAICSKLSRENQLDYDHANISVGGGSKQVIFNAFIATINPGDEVIIPAPYWVSYPDVVSLLEGVPVIVPCLEEGDFKITAAALSKAITRRTKWLVFNSPCNPTGTVYSYEEIFELAQVLLAHPQVYILTDDIYEHLIFDDRVFYTMAQVEPKLKNRILTVNGVSKAYAMTGWRIGYGAGHPDLIKCMSSVQSHSTSSPCSISQAAAAAALEKAPESEQKSIFAKRRDLIVPLLNAIPGIECNNPGGAFYVFACCKQLIGKYQPDGAIINNCSDFTSFLLSEALVATVPGISFGMGGYFRISYTISEDRLLEACRRIKIACSKLA